MILLTMIVSVKLYLKKIIGSSLSTTTGTDMPCSTLYRNEETHVFATVTPGGADRAETHRKGGAQISN